MTMSTKDYYITGLIVCSIFFIGTTIHFYSTSLDSACTDCYPSDATVCENANRMDTLLMKNVNPTAIDSSSAQKMFDLYKQNDSIKEPWGAWIGKEMIDQLFTRNNKNGLSIILGKDTITNETCFIITADSTELRTNVSIDEKNKFLRLNAMCPTYCDGLDPNKHTTR